MVSAAVKLGAIVLAKHLASTEMPPEIRDRVQR
jgi:hypothetical protein